MSEHGGSELGIGLLVGLPCTTASVAFIMVDAQAGLGLATAVAVGVGVLTLIAVAGARAALSKKREADGPEVVVKAERG